MRGSSRFSEPARARGRNAYPIGHQSCSANPIFRKGASLRVSRVSIVAPPANSAVGDGGAREALSRQPGGRPDAENVSVEAGPRALPIFFVPSASEDGRLFVKRVAGSGAWSMSGVFGTTSTSTSSTSTSSTSSTTLPPTDLLPGRIVVIKPDTLAKFVAKPVTGDTLHFRPSTPLRAVAPSASSIRRRSRATTPTTLPVARRGRGLATQPAPRATSTRVSAHRPTRARSFS
jgi:hypothetical protein